MNANPWEACFDVEAARSGRSRTSTTTGSVARNRPIPTRRQASIYSRNANATPHGELSAFCLEATIDR